MFRYKHIPDVMQETRNMMMPGMMIDMAHKLEQMEANEEYIAMMSNVELPEEEVDEDVSEVSEG